MKRLVKTFVYALLLLLGTASCEKSLLDEPAFEQDEEDGNLKVSVFEIEKTVFGNLTRAALSDVCTRINFIAYTPDGERVAKVDQEAGDPDFGAASFFLEPGDYQVVVVAHSSNGNPSSTDPSRIRFTNAQGYTDTFFSSRSVTIGEDEVDMSVSLDRISSLCRFQITDDYPAGVAKMRFRYTGGSGAFNGNTGLGSVNSTQTLLLDITSGQNQFDLYTYLHDTTGTIHLTVQALDVDDNVMFEREFDVPMEKNRVTRLSGAYFSGFTTFSVSVSTDWNDERVINF